MKPIFKIGGHDYTSYLAEDGLSPVLNDLDSEGAGRNLLDGLMYRARIAQKEKWSVKFNRLDETVVKLLSSDLNSEFVQITLLNPKANRVMTKSYYTSTLAFGAQRYDRSDDLTYYYGCSFSITER